MKSFTETGQINMISRIEVAQIFQSLNQNIYQTYRFLWKSKM